MKTDEQPDEWNLPTENLTGPAIKKPDKTVEYPKDDEKEEESE